MSEIFLQEDIATLLDNRFVVIIGDSIQRGVYKDIVLLLQKNRYLTDSQLRSKGEYSYLGDTLVEGGQLGEMTNGVKYREVRQYQTDNHLVRFYFVTRCYNSYVESILKDLENDPIPDVVLMNSCLWDISRYGAQAVDQYKENLEKLFKRLKETLPPSCLVIWNMTLPISKKARGGFLIPAVEFMNSTLRLDILEANFFTHKLALKYGFNTLDLHYFLRHQLQRRADDGVHWDMTAHRRMSNLILSHVAQAWCVQPPGHTRKFVLKDKSAKTSKKQADKKQNHQNQQANSNLCQSERPVGRISPQLLNHLSTVVQKNNEFNDRYFSHKPVSHNDNIHTANNDYNDDHNNHVMNNNHHTGPSLRSVACLVNKGIRINQPHLQPGPFQHAATGINQYNEAQEIYDDQWHNIQRYGGPIRSINFQQPNMNMMAMGNQMCSGNLNNWEPYREQAYNPSLRGGQTYDNNDRSRNIPYPSHSRRRTRMDHY